MKDEIKEILEDIKQHNNQENVIILTENEYTYLMNYITNLQEENTKLKQPQIFIDTMDMEERYGQELYEDYLKEQLEDYKQKNEKAIEIYEKRTTCEYKKKRFMEDKSTSDLMYDALKGEDK